MPSPVDKAKLRRMLQWTGAFLALLITLLVILMERGGLSEAAYQRADGLLTVLGVLLALSLAGSFFFKNRE